MKIVELMNMMNYNLSREANGKSMLGEIEQKITDLHFTSLRNLSFEEQKQKDEYFETNLFTNPEMFDKKINYDGLQDAQKYYNHQKYAFWNKLEMNEAKHL